MFTWVANCTAVISRTLSSLGLPSSAFCSSSEARLTTTHKTVVVTNHTYLHRGPTSMHRAQPSKPKMNRECLCQISIVWKYDYGMRTLMSLEAAASHLSRSVKCAFNAYSSARTLPAYRQCTSSPVAGPTGDDWSAPTHAEAPMYFASGEKSNPSGLCDESIVVPNA